MPTNQVTLKKDELKQLRSLRVRSAEEWIERINRLPEEIQGPAARIVWWDWFGGRSVPDRTDLFDKWIRKFSCEEASFDPLATALIALGYPEKTALTRADDPKSK